KKVGNDWYAIMEEFASYRTGFQEVKYLKDENKKD
ncbi:MAG: MarR family transcriptional regulator, partial [Staphylococcus equorum]|nr:MarR family transcriptional regulator [Staphylococcus equorum]